MPERKVFIKTVIIDCLGVQPEMILCLQRNGTENYVDVTMVGETSFKEFLQQCKEKEDDAPLSNFKVKSLSRNNFRVVTVHMYNPHVTDSTVGLFLCRYVKVISGAKYLRDEFGIWTGKRQFQVLLNDDESGFGGFFHPPANFSIGADRGYLFLLWAAQFLQEVSEFWSLGSGLLSGEMQELW